MTTFSISEFLWLPVEAKMTSFNNRLSTSCFLIKAQNASPNWGCQLAGVTSIIFLQRTMHNGPIHWNRKWLIELQNSVYLNPASCRDKKMEFCIKIAESGWARDRSLSFGISCNGSKFTKLANICEAGFLLMGVMTWSFAGFHLAALDMIITQVQETEGQIDAFRGPPITSSFRKHALNTCWS